jgi:predicted RNase H-like HicB family nuclease
MKLQIKIEQEDDGRWIVEVVDLAGVMVYGATHEEAIQKAKALALQVIIDILENDKTLR